MPVDKDQLRRMIERDVPREEIAAYFNVSVNWINVLVSRMNLGKKQLDHSRYVPRGVSRAHQPQKEYQYLHLLSHVAQTEEITSELGRVLSAFSWAEAATTDGLDRAYDPKRGFYLSPYSVDKGVWALAELVELVSPVLAKVSTSKDHNEALMTAATRARSRALTLLNNESNKELRTS